MAALTTQVSGVPVVRLILTTASTQLFFTAAVDGQILVLILEQDTTGGRAVTSGNVPGIQAPTQTASADTIYLLIYDAAAATWQSFIISPTS
jgi:hypothetical protein